MDVDVMKNRLNKISTIFFFLLFVIASGCDSSNEANEEKNLATSESSTEKSDICEITCPYCGHKEIEVLPTEVCQIKYTCKNCGEVLTPKDGDCCVFCSYGSHKCPSMQEEK